MSLTYEMFMSNYPELFVEVINQGMLLADEGYAQFNTVEEIASALTQLDQDDMAFWNSDAPHIPDVDSIDETDQYEP